MQLKDKVAIITGSASGIGKEIALEYAKEGAKVVIADLALAAAQATADEINKSGGKAMAVEMNVTDEAAVDAATAKVVAKEGAKDGIRANVICPGFVRTPLVEKQIPEQSKALGISEADVIRNVMLKDTVDGEFTTVQDVAQTAVFLAAFRTNALTGQSITVSHGWHMQ